MQFKFKIQEVAKANNSRIVLALDFPFQNPNNNNSSHELFSKADAIIEQVSSYICAVKFNNHLVLPLGLFNGVKVLVEHVHAKGLLAIMDAKVNDIGNTNQIIADYYYAAGFDAIIANPFIGWEDGLKPLFEVSRKQGKGVILLTYMSHKGAAEGYGQTVTDPVTGVSMSQYMMFAQKDVTYAADGAVVGATVPEKIKEIYQILGEKVPIYSPGVGSQGGSAQDAVKAGATYLIVGREIISAENPAAVARKLWDSTKLI
ncbi:MAG: orotidine 5'-phosphate decarboxylase [Candidatus Bathyarchaeota archaeon]|nr:orotidine 5'-phosphate decarboxylase [Candidatus Termiticorpusculum sp.]